MSILRPHCRHFHWRASGYNSLNMVLCAETHRLISVMLGTLRMDIDTCINEYIDMAPEIFPVENIVSGSTLGKL